MLVLRLQHASSRFFRLLMTSPCLWRKLQNLSFSKVSKQVITSFYVASADLSDIATCLIMRRKLFSVAGTLLIRFVCNIILRGNGAVLATLHLTLYTQHSTKVCTVNSTLHYTLLHPTTLYYTLHLTLHTWHSTLYTPHITLWTPHFTLDTLHSTLALHTLHSTQYALYFTLHTLHFTLHTLHSHSALYTLRSTLYTLYSIPYTPHFTLYTLHLTLCSTLCTLHFTLYTVHSTLYTLHTALCYTTLPQQQLDAHAARY